MPQYPLIVLFSYIFFEPLNLEPPNPEPLNLTLRYSPVGEIPPGKNPIPVIMFRRSKSRVWQFRPGCIVLVFIKGAPCSFKVNQSKVTVNSEPRTSESWTCERLQLNTQIHKYSNVKSEEWIPIKKISDRIYRIIWIAGPSAKGYLAAGEKNPINPVNPVKKKEIKNRIHSTLSALEGKNITANMLP